jgi:heme-NO-binding protein
MKGIIFTSFLEMIEEKLGIDFVDEIIEETNPASGGSYTAVGYYDHNELVNLVVRTSEKTNQPVDDLLLGYGRYLFEIFVVDYAEMIGEVSNIMDFLERVESYIHPEVKKLYPESSPPTFVVELREDNKMIFIYESKRSMSMVAKGLIEKGAEHFEEKFKIEMDNIEDDGSKVRFTLIRE